MFFQVSSSGGNQKFYVELLKYNGTTFTSIASSSAVPEEITGGTAIDLYLTSLAVPTTALLITDRLVIRVYIVDNSGGRTVTLHTEDNTLCEIVTTFAGGISALNGLSANTQYLATGTSGTDFAISSLTDTHTFNLPTASATNRGALSSADWTTFNNKVPTTRTLTINGTAYDLSADRSWTVSGGGTTIYSGDGTLAGDRIVTSNGNSLTILGGKEEISGFPSEQISLRLQGSTTAKNPYISLKNTNASGKDYALRSMVDGTFDIFNITNLGSVFKYDHTNNLTQFRASTNLTDLGFYLGSNASVLGLWLNGTRTIGSYAIIQNSGSTYLNTASGGTIGFRVNNAEKMTLTAAGRLLLGTTDEGTYKLDVNGTARVNGMLTFDSATGGTFRIANNSTNDWDIGEAVGESTRNFNIYNYNAGALSFSINRATNVVTLSALSTTTGTVTNLNASTITAFTAPNFTLDRVGGGYFIIKNNSTNDWGLGEDTGEGTRNFNFYNYNTTSIVVSIKRSTGNVIIGGTTESTSARLQVNSTTQGFLPPRMTTTEKNAIGTPAAGLMVFDTTLSKLCVYSGTAWETITSI